MFYPKTILFPAVFPFLMEQLSHTCKHVPGTSVQVHSHFCMPSPRPTHPNSQSLRTRLIPYRHWGRGRTIAQRSCVQGLLPQWNILEQWSVSHRRRCEETESDLENCFVQRVSNLRQWTHNPSICLLVPLQII